MAPIKLTRAVYKKGFCSGAGFNLWLSVVQCALRRGCNSAPAIFTLRRRCPCQVFFPVQPCIACHACLENLGKSGSLFLHKVSQNSAGMSRD